LSEDGTKMHRKPSLITGIASLNVLKQPLSYRARMLSNLEDMRSQKTHGGTLVVAGKLNNVAPTVREDIERRLSKKKVSLSQYLSSARALADENGSEVVVVSNDPALEA